MPISPQEALQRCIEQRDIVHDEMLHLFRQIMRGELSPVMIAALIVALRVKKESVSEITAAALAMREFMTTVSIPYHQHLVDIVGTGGDGAHTFNISTAAMFVAAAAGAKVAKHGNRSVSSLCGSADVLEALGVNIGLNPVDIQKTIEATNIGFMFAPNHHPAMKHAALVRKELGVRTIFNILGPLTNPAGAKNILMGVFHPDLVGIQIRVLQRLGAQHALVIWALDNMDEASLGAATLVGELVNGEIREYHIHPEDFGLPMISSRHFKVDNKEQSKEKIWAALGTKPSPERHIVAFNAGLAIYAANLAPTIESGVHCALKTIESGLARAKLDEFVRLTQTFTPTP